MIFERVRKNNGMMRVIATTCILPLNMACFQKQGLEKHEYSKMYLNTNPIVACCQNLIPSIDRSSKRRILWFFLKTVGIITSHSLHSLWIVYHYSPRFHAVDGALLLASVASVIFSIFAFLSTGRTFADIVLIRISLFHLCNHRICLLWKTRSTKLKKQSTSTGKHIRF